MKYLATILLLVLVLLCLQATSAAPQEESETLYIYNADAIIDVTTYYFMALFQYDNTVLNGADDSFATSGKSRPPTVTTENATNITTASATLNMAYDFMKYRSVQVQFKYKAEGASAWSETGWVSKTRSGTHSFSEPIAGLSSGTTYYFIALLKYDGTVLNGTENSFTTSRELTPPTVTTKNATNITTASATLNMTYVFMDYSSVQVQFKYKAEGASGWDETGWVAQSGSGTHSFSESIAGLSSGTTYYFMAQLKYGGAVLNGTENSFTTSSESRAPTVSTKNATNITTASATLNTSYDFMDYSSVHVQFRYKAEGVSAWDETSWVSQTGSGTHSFSESIAGLSSGTTYHFLAMLLYDDTVLNGTEISFTTSSEPRPPTVTTENATNVTTASTTLNMAYDFMDYSSVHVQFKYKAEGASAWNETGWVAQSGSDSHSFSESIASLSSNKTYYFSAQLKYNGTVLNGTESSFTTSSEPRQPAETILIYNADAVINLTASTPPDDTLNSSDALPQDGVKTILIYNADAVIDITASTPPDDTLNSSDALPQDGVKMMPHQPPKQVTTPTPQKFIHTSRTIPPEEEWNRTFGGPDKDWATAVQQTTDSGYILAGATESYGAGSSDFWLVKTDSSGDKQWDKTFGGPDDDRASSVQQTTDGGYILSGSTMPYGAGWCDFWLVKTDSSGDKQWDKTFGGPDGDYAYSVQQTSDSGYILAGDTWSYGAGWCDFWLVKTDSNGNVEWNRTFGESNHDEARSVRQTTDGGYILAGATESYGADSFDFWLVKTDSNGNKQWDKIFGGPDWDYAYSVQQTSDGGYILAGSSYDDDDFWLVKVKGEPGENQLPIANFTYSPQNPIINQIITFDASNSTDPDGTIVKYEWDFGDGNTATGKIVTHSYPSVGAYAVTLTTTDNDGATDSISKEICIGIEGLLNVPFFSQRDPKWCDKKLDHSPCSIGMYGCALTSLAMVSKYYGYDTDPDRLNTSLTGVGGLDEYGSLDWRKIEEITDEAKYEGWWTGSWEKIDQELSESHPVIANVSYPTTGYPYHFIVFIGKIEDKYYFLDPYDLPQCKEQKEIREWPNGKLGTYTLLNLRIYHGSLPPIADAGQNQSVFSGSLVILDGSNSYDPDPGGTIVRYEWDFGDGETAEGRIVTHRFRGAADQPRTYAVTLTVEDDTGDTDTDTTYITVMPLEKTVEVTHLVLVPLDTVFARMRVSYNWIYDNSYVVSKIHYESEGGGFLGVATISIWDMHSHLIPTPLWATNIFSHGTSCPTNQL